MSLLRIIPVALAFAVGLTWQLKLLTYAGATDNDLILYGVVVVGFVVFRGKALLDNHRR